MFRTLLPLMLLVPGDAPPEPKWPIGKETTYVTGPVDKDGYIDYEAALNERLGKGVTPENNANVLIWKAIGPRPEGGRMHPDYWKSLGIEEPPENGDYIIGIRTFLKERLKLDGTELDSVVDEYVQATSRPWKAKDYPHLAAWLTVNQKPLAIALKATRRPEYFNPLVASRSKSRKGLLIAALLPNVQRCRLFALAFSARAMLRVDEGKFDEAWQDLLACHRLGRLVSRGATLIEYLVGMAVDNIAGSRDLVYVRHAPLTARQFQERANELRGLPSLALAADKLDLGERFVMLQVVQFVYRLGPSVLKGLDGAPGDNKTNPFAPIVDGVTGMAIAAMDWGPVLRNTNKWFDRAVAIMRTEDRSTRERELAKYTEDLKALKEKGTLSPPAVTVQNIGDVMIGHLMPAFNKVQAACDRYGQTERNLFLAFALAAYRADHGRFPAKLDELAPKYLPVVPDDLFAGKPLVYRPSESGYLLYSVGPNSKDDGGRGTGDDPPGGDDIAVRMTVPPAKPGP